MNQNKKKKRRSELCDIQEPQGASSKNATRRSLSYLYHDAGNKLFTRTKM